MLGVAFFALLCLWEDSTGLSARPRRKSSIGSRRKPPPSRAPESAPAPPAFDAAFLCLAQDHNEDAYEALAVREECRGAACGDAPWFEFVALDDLFPGSGLGEAFDESAAFREALRLGARADRVSADSPVRFDLAASAQGSWMGSADSPELDRALRDALGAGAPTGGDFLGSIGSLRLAGTPPKTGHFIEIVGGPGATRVARHAWHQDRGGDDGAVTAMLGFPPTDRYVGCGVFSHVCPLRNYVVNGEVDHASPREFHPASRFLAVDGESVPAASVVRPSYARGREVLVYSDARTCHTSPDVVHRDCLWRFM